MYELFYNQVTEVLQTSEEVLLRINEIQNKETEAKLVAISTEANGSMEIAVGMGDKSIVFYTPEAEDENACISCNEFVDRAKIEDFQILDANNEKCDFSVANFVNFANALLVMKAFLNKEEFWDFVDWYEY
jgi:hypothetical protein